MSNHPTPEKTILAQGRFIRLVRAGKWEFAERIHTQPPVGIVAVTSDNKLLLIEQFRHPIGKNVIEIPAGLVGDVPGQESESLEIAAQRELLEETGYTADRIEFLTEGPPSAGLSNEIIRLVRAHNLTKTGPGGGDPSENITLHEIPLLQVPAFLAARQKAGTPIDPKVYAALYFALTP